MRKLTHTELLTRQRQWAKQPRVPLTVVLNNIRSLHNVGSIFRTADGIGVEKIWLTGITGYPPQAALSKTALGAEETVPWEQHEDAAVVVRQLKSAGYHIVLLEQTDESRPYQLYPATAPLCLVVGNEIEGVCDRLLALSDGAVDIDMAGVKNSLNVAVAFGVVAYHFRHQLAATEG